jgi:hypothetical protein
VPDGNSALELSVVISGGNFQADGIVDDGVFEIDYTPIKSPYKQRLERRTGLAQRLVQSNLLSPKSYPPMKA